MFLVVVSIIIGISNNYGFSQPCPAFTHLVTSEKQRADAPDGYYVFGVYDQKGLLFPAFLSALSQEALSSCSMKLALRKNPESCLAFFLALNFEL